MTHPAMPVRFWAWENTGVYLGMPLKTFGGWALTGLPFMALSQVLWQRDATIRPDRMWFPLVMYVANVAFADALSASVGLWLPSTLAGIVGLGSAIVAALPPERLPRLLTRRSGGARPAS